MARILRHCCCVVIDRDEFLPISIYKSIDRFACSCCQTPLVQINHMRFVFTCSLIIVLISIFIVVLFQKLRLDSDAPSVEHWRGINIAHRGGKAYVCRLIVFIEIKL
jgi:hypothetical protein